MKHITLFLLLGVFFTSVSFAQDKSKHFKAKSVSIFKNNSAFFIKEGKVKTKDGSFIMTENLPRALFGTFWIHSPNKELRQIITYQDTVVTKKEIPATQMIDILKINNDKKIKIHIGKDEVYEGIAKVSPKTNNSYTIILKTTKGEWMVFSSREIRRIEFLEEPLQFTDKKTSKVQYVLSVDFTTKKGEQPLEMMYLQNGINWVPNYLIELESDTKATLSLRAEVTNGAEDIVDTDVNFVVGIPNFSYANRLSALVDFLGQISPRPIRHNGFPNISQQMSSYNLNEVTVTNARPTTPVGGNGVTGESDEDLYFYNVKNITLKKNGRGQYPIFKEKIDIAHIYETNLQQNPTTANSYQKDFLFSVDNKNPVYHSIKINNDLKFPWTTGAAMVVSKKSGITRPISQDLLKYTPIKGHSYVKLTESPDIKVKYAEKEIARKQKAKRINDHNYFYDLITVEGKIKVKSYKSKSVDLNIKRTISGELLKSSVKWLKEERINRSNTPNKTTNVCWETSIKEGEEIEITYTYDVYIPQYY